MKQPFFSIITCTYNSEKFLSTNINSIKEQTFKDFEHVFIDGFSIDNTLSLIKEYQKENNNVFLYQYPPKGIANAMNQGIRHAQGKYLFFLHSDDCLADKDVLQKVYDFITVHPAPWYYGQVKYVGDFVRKNNLYPFRWYHKRFFYPVLMLTDFIHHQGVFLKREIFEKYGGYDESLNGPMDYEYWLRIGKKEKPKFLPFIISHFRAGAGYSGNLVNRPSIIQQNIRLKRKYTRFPLFFTYPWVWYQNIILAYEKIIRFLKESKK